MWARLGLNSRSCFSHWSSVIWWIFKCLEIHIPKSTVLKWITVAFGVVQPPLYLLPKQLNHPKEWSLLTSYSLFPTLPHTSLCPRPWPLTGCLVSVRIYLSCTSWINGMAVACVASFMFRHVFKVHPHRDQIIFPLMYMLQSYLSLYLNGAGGGILSGK